MKKAFMILGSCLMAALVIVSCGTKDPTPKPNGGRDGGDDKGNENEFKMEVAIDGDFSDWDALTSETSDGGNYIYEENSNSDIPAILRVKATSDKDYFYVYAEIDYGYIFQAEGGPFEPGNSNDGFHPSHPGSPGPLWVWIDADGDASGAVSTASEDEQLWAYNGFDAPLQYYFCFDVEQNKCQMGWQQVNWPMDGEDFLTSASDDWGRAFVGGEGWDPNTDWIASTTTDIAFSAPMSIKDPASGSNVQAVKMEIAISLDGILPNSAPVADKLVFGLSYENQDETASCMHNLLSEVTGKVPSGNQPLTIKLLK